MFEISPHLSLFIDEDRSEEQSASHLVSSSQPQIFDPKTIFNDISNKHFQSWTRQIQTRKQHILRVAVLDRWRQPLLSPTIWIWIRRTTAVVIGRKKQHPLPPLVKVLPHNQSDHCQFTRRSVRCVWNHCKWMLQLIIVWCVVGKECINIVTKVLATVQWRTNKRWPVLCAVQDIQEQTRKQPKAFVYG